MTEQVGVPPELPGGIPGGAERDTRMTQAPAQAQPALHAPAGEGGGAGAGGGGGLDAIGTTVSNMTATQMFEVGPRTLLRARQRGMRRCRRWRARRG